MNIQGENKNSIHLFSNVSVVMATKNEEHAIKKVIDDINRNTESQAEIIIVDGSDDKTAQIAESLNAIVFKQEPRGYGFAMIMGLLSASREIIITLDCDNSYPAGSIPEFIVNIERGYDVVSGSRLLQNNDSMPIINKIGNHCFALLSSLLYGIRVTDVTTGMRAYKKSVIRDIIWTENTGLSAELLLKPAKKGYRILEIPIVYNQRIGLTKLNPVTGGFEIFFSIIKCRFVD